MKGLGRRLPNEVKGNVCLTVGAHALRADGGLEQVRGGLVRLTRQFPYIASRGCSLILRLTLRASAGTLWNR
jgi:hypothetical protein